MSFRFQAAEQSAQKSALEYQEKREKMNTELMEALNILEQEKNISKGTLLEAIEQSLLQACKNHFGKAGKCEK